MDCRWTKGYLRAKAARERCGVAAAGGYGPLIRFQSCALERRKWNRCRASSILNAALVDHPRSGVGYFLGKRHLGNLAFEFSQDFVARRQERRPCRSSRMGLVAPPWRWRIHPHEVRISQSITVKDDMQAASSTYCDATAVRPLTGLGEGTPTVTSGH